MGGDEARGRGRSREALADRVDEVDRAGDRLETLYRATGVPDRWGRRYGDGGHRFFSATMWPWIMEAVGRSE